MATQKLSKVLIAVLLVLTTPLLAIQSPPKSVEEIKNFVKETLQEFDRSTEALSVLENPLNACNQIANHYFASAAFLFNVDLIFSDPALIEEGKKGFVELQKAFVLRLKELHLIEPVLAYLEKKQELTPSEKNYVSCFLERKQEIQNPALQKRFELLKSKFTLEGATPFTYLKGESHEKNGADPLTLLSWNVCCLPGHLPSVFGGVLPSHSRLDGVSELIIDANADIICLQEVFDEKTALALFEDLKSHYSHFYINIAPKHFCFDQDPPSLGSGLFVASKCHIEDVSWTKFSHRETPYIERGFFSFVVEKEGKKLVITNTHLEPTISESQAAHFRTLQLEEILSRFDEDIAHKNLTKCPHILCGDLNISWGSKEASEKMLQTYFYDAYNEKRKNITFEDCTHCDYTGHLWPNYFLNADRRHFTPVPAILDYTLLLKELPSGITSEGGVCIKTKRLEASHISDPTQALSDHQPLFTTISFGTY